MDKQPVSDEVKAQVREILVDVHDKFNRYSDLAHKLHPIVEKAFEYYKVTKRLEHVSRGHGYSDIRDREIEVKAARAALFNALEEMLGEKKDGKS